MMRPPVEGLGRQAHAPGSGIMVLYCEYGCSCVVVFFFPDFLSWCVFTGTCFVGFGFHTYTRWKQNLRI